MTGRVYLCCACIVASACAMAAPRPMDGGETGDAATPDADFPDAGRDLPDVGPPTCADPSRWYRDLDGDGFGDPAASVESCDHVEGFATRGDDCDDGCADCHPGGFEVCDARDNDCDGAADQLFACAPGAAVACTTSCGTTGAGACTSACEAPSAEACAPPAETCNGADDDCDGDVDETFSCAAGATALCTTTCGSTGTGTCTSACEPAAPAACTPPAETCNGLDDDCDGVADQTFACAAGAAVTCTTSCGTVGRGACTSACGLPSGAACAPLGETCNGLDDDCDGIIDDGFPCAAGRSASCTTSCGSTGTGFCTASCAPAAPSACAPPAEACTNADDDCDGLIDEGVMGGGAPVVVDYAYYQRPRVALGTSSKIYAVYALSGRAYLWRLNADGTLDRSRVVLANTTEYDLASNAGGRVVFAWIEAGDVWVHELQPAPAEGALYRWSRRIDTDAIEVRLAVGSANVWVYTRNAAGRVELHTLDILTGAALAGPEYVATSPMRIAVTSNGYRHHTVAVHVTDWIFWFQYDATYGRESSGVLPVDRLRLQDFAIAGDYSTSPIRRNGLVIAYSLLASGSQPAELRYYSWRDGGATTDQRIATGTTPYSSLYPQLDLEMHDGIAQLGAVWTSSSSASTGAPRVYQLSRSASGAAYSVNAITYGLPSELHQGIGVIRFPDSAGPVADRLFYDPPDGGIASVPIGCP